MPSKLYPDGSIVPGTTWSVPLSAFEQAKEYFKDILDSEGTISSLGWYLHYKPSNQTAVLDGDFTAEDLRQLANYMEGSNG